MLSQGPTFMAENLKKEAPCPKESYLQKQAKVQREETNIATRILALLYAVLQPNMVPKSAKLPAKASYQIPKTSQSEHYHPHP